MFLTVVPTLRVLSNKPLVGSAGLLISASLRNGDVAVQIAPAAIVLFLVFSGYFLNDNSIPVYLDWLKYLSFIRYGFMALAVNEFRNATFSCTPQDGYCLSGNDHLEVGC